MGLEYFNHEDTAMRLHGSICFYKNHPYIVSVSRDNDLPSDKHVRLFHLGSGSRAKSLVVDYTTDDFDYTPKELGYVNIEPYAYFCARVPSRIQKQGLVSDQISVYGGRFHPADLFNTKQFENMLLNKYPSIKNVISSLQSSIWVSMGVSKDFKIAFENQVFYLHFRDTVVGISRNGIDYTEIPGYSGMPFIRRALSKQKVEVKV